MEYVAGLMFSEDKKTVAMVLKNRPAWQAGLFNAIGGKIEEGEAPATAMAREFLEETGVETTPLEWMFHTRLEGDDFNVFFYKMFSDKVRSATTRETEAIHLLNPYNLPINVIHNLRWIIALALDEHVIVPVVFPHK